MSDSAERLRRLLFLVPYLSQHKGVQIDELAKAMGLSRAEVLEDLELLPLVGRPPFTPADYIDLTIENDRVSLTLDQRFSRPPRLTAPEAAALAAAAAALDPREGDALSRALEKLEEALPPHARGAYQTLRGRVTAAGDAGLEDLLRPLAESVVRRRELVIEYLSPTSERALRRTVRPWRVFSHRGLWYLFGLDVAKKAERLFRVDRITRLTTTEARFERPKDLPEPGEELLPRSRKQAAAEPPVLRFARRIATLALERFPDEAEKERDGRVTVTLPGATEEWLVSLVLTHAGGVEVLGPDSLRERVREAVARQLALYRDA
ncbi:MAG: WYL domain-containing protein [Deltaproteobacteria bacterium]|nr:WYL domain-containing protein [Deltaproteobacteria bacterium]